MTTTATTTSTATLAQQILDIMAAKLSLEGEITASTAFADLDLDSLVMLELSVLLEQKLGARLTDEQLIEAGSVNAIAALLHDHPRSATA
ncbi:acyl carrier protein [Kitasatospora mediocidica]|uniref:acyl carrier protein n=1 Tax=Kitasatospora mediocidica TaxID=58352 RepID=UPI00055E5596|nr:acyl carrier protein [Kitasatospora mediocidica]